MAQEPNEGISYLAALKRGAGPGAATAAVPAVETNPAVPVGSSGATGSASSQPSFQGAEKRRSTRYKCEGSVEMRQVDSDVHTWATFTDVSVHGCYLEAQATYPVGTVLHLKMEANGMKVEGTGNVRVSYPYLGMGVAFTEMTEEHRARLRDLLTSVSRPSMIMGPGIASSLPARGSIGVLPVISDHKAAVQSLIEFFEDRQMLMREDFLRILRQSQPGHAK
jgi:PilZ domain